MQAVIARSFAFIYARNQPSLGLLGITMDDDAFFEAAIEGEEISIDVPSSTITVAGRNFNFNLSEMEYMLTMNKGIAESYQKYGKAIWENLTKSGSQMKLRKAEQTDHGPTDDRLNW